MGNGKQERIDLYAHMVAGKPDRVAPLIETDEDGRLLCPHCDGQNLHHVMVVVHERVAEDGSGLEFVIAKGGETSSGFLAKDSVAFAGRRNDVKIGFRCENCTADLTLQIKQHKGETFLDWYIVEDKRVGMMLGELP